MMSFDNEKCFYAYATLVKTSTAMNGGSPKSLPHVEQRYLRDDTINLYLGVEGSISRGKEDPFVYQNYSQIFLEAFVIANV